MIITFRDHFRKIPIRGKKCGHCVDGTKRFFDRHGLDWKDFIKNGIEEELLIATDDARAIAVVEFAHEQINNGTSE